MADWSNPQPYWLRGPQGIQAYLTGTQAAVSQGHLQNETKQVGMQMATDALRQQLMSQELDANAQLLPLKQQLGQAELKAKTRMEEEAVLDQKEWADALSQNRAPNFRNPDTASKWALFDARRSALNAEAANKAQYIKQRAALGEYGMSLPPEPRTTADFDDLRRVEAMVAKRKYAEANPAGSYELGGEKFVRQYDANFNETVTRIPHETASHNPLTAPQQEIFNAEIKRLRAAADNKQITELEYRTAVNRAEKTMGLKPTDWALYPQQEPEKKSIFGNWFKPTETPKASLMWDPSAGTFK